MTEAPEAPTANPEFQLDEEIEVSSWQDFSMNLVKGKFKHLDPDGYYWIVDKDGKIRRAKFARKVEPMVEIMQAGVCRYYKIPKSLMDKIIAGEAL